MRDMVAAACVALVLTQARVEGQPPFALDRLTVPADRLVPGCGLPQLSTERVGPSQTRSGLWAGLPISTNPWSGNDRSIVATIRERVVGLPRLPDGFPVSGAELWRFRRDLASDVEQAYAAIYTDAGPYLVVVLGVMVSDATDPATLLPRGPRAGHVLIPDRTIALVSGGVGPCFEAVASYVKEIATP